ncbi:MAG: T9SS type A sorting domain-containing protein [Bacteroidota bacterium]
MYTLTTPSIYYSGRFINFDDSDSNSDDYASNLSVYPNPNNGIFTMELSSDREIEISNILGEKIMIKFLPEGQNQINMNDQPNGIYFVKIITGNKQEVIKIIKEN